MEHFKELAIVGAGRGVEPVMQTGKPDDAAY